MRLWGLTKPPTSGIKVGTLDGANTYLLTLSLIDYRRIKFPETGKSASTAAVKTDDSPDALAFKRACGGGHDLPSPQAYSREAWPGVTRKMMGYIAEQGLEISERDVMLSLRYLRRHALSPRAGRYRFELSRVSSGSLRRTEPRWFSPHARHEKSSLSVS